MLRFNKLAMLAMLISALTLSVKAEEVFGLTSDGKLIRFDSTAPETIITSVTITGLQTSETLHGIDFRAFDGKLYGLGSTSRLYTINPTTGVATQIGTSQFSTLLSGTKFGFDFNPFSGAVGGFGIGSLIRVVSDTGQNLRVNALTGALQDVQATPVYLTGGFTGTPSVTGAAYNNNTAGTAGTTLYVIDNNADALFIQDFNTHSLTLVGSLGLNVTDSLGFDISGQTGIAYAALQLNGTTTSSLYQINLTNGGTSPLGTIGGGAALLGIAVPTAPVQLAYGINGGALRKFPLNSPSTQLGADVNITGGAATGIVAIDFRPATGQLYAVTSNGGAFGIYSIDVTTGASTQVGSNFVLPNTPGGTYDIDFNPTVDRIRFVASSGTNARFHPDTGAVVAIDGNLAFAAGDVSTGSPQSVAVAYINNFNNIGGTTTLYNIDNLNDVLTTQIPPNSGTLNTVGGLKVNALTPPSNTDAGSNAAFDIAPDGRAFATLNGANLYQINLATGTIVLVGAVTGSVTEFAIPTNGGAAAGNPGTISFSSADYQVVEGQLGAITLNRTGGSSGLVSVYLSTLTTNANTATEGVDYSVVGQTVSFSDGETTRTILVEALTDSTLEVFETATLQISNPVGAALATVKTASLTIVDVDDRDGDGFTTAEELAAGTSDTDASSTPFGGAPAGAADTTNMTVTKVAVKLNFTKTNSDSISFSGTIGAFTVTDLATLENQKFVVNFGGVSKSLTLNSKGKGVSTDKKDSVSIGKPKNNVTKFSVKFNKGDFDTALTDEGLGADTDNPSKAPRTVIVRVLFNGKAYVESLALEAKITSKGSAAKNAKLPR